MLNQTPLKEKIAYVILVISAVLSCYFAHQNMMYQAIFFRVISLSSIAYVFYLYKKFRSILFYIALVFALIGESYVMLGMKKYPLEVMVFFFIYYWLLFFVIKSNVREVNFWKQKKVLVSALISIAFIIYLFVVSYNMVIESYKDKAFLIYVSTFTFLFLIAYMGLVYINKMSLRNFWLVPAIVSLVFIRFIFPMEAYYYNSLYFKCLGLLVQVARHFFILKYLISAEKEVIIDNKESYL